MQKNKHEASCAPVPGHSHREGSLRLGVEELFVSKVIKKSVIFSAQPEVDAIIVRDEEPQRSLRSAGERKQPEHGELSPNLCLNTRNPVDGEVINTSQTVCSTIIPIFFTVCYRSNNCQPGNAFSRSWQIFDAGCTCIQGLHPLTRLTKEILTKQH